MRGLPVTDIEHEVKVSLRAVRIGARVLPGGRVVVTVPPGCSYVAVARFLRRHRDWIERTRERMARVPAPPTRKESRAAYVRHKEAARRLCYALIARYAPVYGVSVRAVSIRDQSSRWGSCSRDGRLSFNYRLALLPERLAEYVVVHELCHMLRFDHSRRFWALVARAVPEHKLLRAALREYHLAAA